MINTYVAFYYGHTIDDTNNKLDFKEGVGSQLTATLNVGEYTLTDFGTELARALNEAGALTYTVSINRTTRIITISATGAFTILGATGTNLSTHVLSLAGFAAADTSSAASHAGTSASGSEWLPQFKPQDYVDFDDQQLAIDGVVKQSADGTVEAVKFGNKKIMDSNFMFITNISQPGDLILNQVTGVDNARAFLVYATTKAPLEFMADASDRYSFEDCILESTPESQDGLSFKLKEMYGKGLPGYFETGVLKFRLL